MRAGYHGHLVSKEFWHRAFALMKPHCFPGSSILRMPDKEGSSGEKSWVEEVRDEAPDRFVHHILYTASPAPPSDPAEAVGCYHGYFQQPALYWMITSAVHPSHQRRGIYGAILESVLAFAKDAGVGAILSQHRADNNAIIIPKLKAGFLITSLRVSPVQGLMVELALALVPHVETLHRFRIKAEPVLEEALASGLIAMPGDGTDT